LLPRGAAFAALHLADKPRRPKMIELYYWPTPNGHKVTMFLEEAGLDYTIHPVDISAGDQFKPDFLAHLAKQPHAGDH
jgi:hypothetical protein